MGGGRGTDVGLGGRGEGYRGRVRRGTEGG